MSTGFYRRAEHNEIQNKMSISGMASGGSWTAVSNRSGQIGIYRRTTCSGSTTSNLFSSVFGVCLYVPAWEGMEMKLRTLHLCGVWSPQATGERLELAGVMSWYAAFHHTKMKIGTFSTHNHSAYTRYHQEHQGIQP